MKSSLLIASLIALSSLTMVQTADAGSASRGGARYNGSGGVSAASAQGTRDSYGHAGRAQGYYSTGSGNAAAGHVAGAQGYYGSAGHASGAVMNSQGAGMGGRTGAYATTFTAGGHAGGIASDGNGNAVGGMEGMTVGAFGHSGTRIGGTAANVDGSISHSSGFLGDGNRGSVESAGSFYQDQSGNTNGIRYTDVNADNGAAYQGTTTYANGSGVEHNVDYTTQYGGTYSW